MMYRMVRHKPKIRPTGDALVARAEEGRETTAIVVGEASRAFEPAVSEWGNPVLLCRTTSHCYGARRELSELKHLSKRRKRNSPSSGERKGRSLNRA